jgi:hypothetical protein
MTIDSDDLSAGINTTTDLSTGLLRAQRQKEQFKRFSFYLAWGMSLLFFMSVILFSWYLVFYPNAFLGTDHFKINIAHPELSKNLQNNASTIEAQKNINLPPLDNKEAKQFPATAPLLNQFLILLALLSAIGTTLAIAVMRFSFYEETENKRDTDSSLVSPMVSSISNLINQVVDLLKKD